MKEVNEIIEIVFERVDLVKVVGLLTRWLSNSRIENYTIATDSSAINFHSEEKLLNSIEQSSDGAFYFNLLDFTLEDILLLRLGLGVYKYDNAYDLNLHIEEKEIRQKLSISDFQKRIESLAGKLQAANYYLGYEPAIDEETRFFSGNTLGPLKEW